jgi:hypothetical protein
MLILGGYLATTTLKFDDPVIFCIEDHVSILTPVRTRACTRLPVCTCQHLASLLQTQQLLYLPASFTSIQCTPD